MDEWVPEAAVQLSQEQAPELPRGKKRKRGEQNGDATHSGHESSPSSPAEERFGGGAGRHDDDSDSDLSEQRLLTAKRNFDKVQFGNWQLKTWRVHTLSTTDLRSC